MERRNGERQRRQWMIYEKRTIGEKKGERFTSELNQKGRPKRNGKNTASHITLSEAGAHIVWLDLQNAGRIAEFQNNL